MLAKKITISVEIIESVFDGRYYNIYIRAYEDYTNYIIYGLATSIIDTFTIVLIWKRLLPTYKQQPR